MDDLALEKRILRNLKYAESLLETFKPVVDSHHLPTLQWGLRILRSICTRFATVEALATNYVAAAEPGSLAWRRGCAWRDYARDHKELYEMALRDMVEDVEPKEG
jgi:hypothetical protein